MLSRQSIILKSVSYPQTEVNHYFKSGTWNLGNLLIILMNSIDWLQCIVPCYLPINSLPQSAEKPISFLQCWKIGKENITAKILLLSLCLLMAWCHFLLFCIDGLVQYCIISTANVLAILQACTEPSICFHSRKCCSIVTMLQPFWSWEICQFITIKSSCLGFKIAIILTFKCEWYIV